jgi:hypothetical protein
MLDKVKLFLTNKQQALTMIQVLNHFGVPGEAAHENAQH